jgi:HlyD family secretion protein
VTPDVATSRQARQARRACLLAVLLVAGCSAPADRPLLGYVEGEYVRIAAPFAGQLQQLSVRRGGEVAVGAPVFALERDNEVAARRQAEQQLQSALARLDNLKTGKRPSEVQAVAE